MARLLAVADPLSSWRIYKDSTYAMLREAARRGHEIWVCELGDLQADGDLASARASRIRLHNAETWHTVEQQERLPLTAFASVLMRKDPPFDLEYLTATHILQLAESHGAHIVNRPQALRDHNEKLAILQFPQWIAPTRVSRDMDALRQFVQEQGMAVLKPLDSMGGEGIFRVAADDANLSVILETMTARGQRSIMAQRYLPQIAEGDKRILLIDGVAVDWSLARIPQPGETRGNLAAGGRGVAMPLTAREAQIAADLGPQLRARGLLLVGLDVIGGFVTEINVTSPTCFQEISEQSGIDVAGLFMDALQRQWR